MLIVMGVKIYESLCSTSAENRFGCSHFPGLAKTVVAIIRKYRIGTRYNFQNILTLFSY